MTIRSEIETRLRVWADAQVPPIPVAVENLKFNKPKTGMYLELFFLGDPPTLRNLAANGVRRTGIFQINCYGAVNTGMGQVEELASAVCDLFPVIPKTGAVSIESPLSWSGGFEQDGFVCVPVRANYRVET